MKYIENYRSFNESLIPKFLRKKKEIEEERKALEIYDDTVSKIIQRVKDIFDFKNLERYSADSEGVKKMHNYGDYKHYSYNLEETDSNEGFINIDVNRKNNTYSNEFYYKLKIDNFDVPCSKQLMEDLYNFFENQLLNRVEIEERKKAIDFRNKYKNITGDK